MKFLKSIKKFIGNPVPLEYLNYKLDKKYVFQNGKIVVDESQSRYINNIKNLHLLKWRDQNKGKVLIKEMCNLLSTHSYKSIISQKVFISDLKEICDKRNLDLLKILYKVHDYKGMFVEVTIHEEKFEKFDGLPEDIISYYIDYIKGLLNKKKEEYGKLHNISNLYKIKRSYETSDYTEGLEYGIFTFEICISY